MLKATHTGSETVHYLGEIRTRLSPRGQGYIHPTATQRWNSAALSTKGERDRLESEKEERE